MKIKRSDPPLVVKERLSGSSLLMHPVICQTVRMYRRHVGLSMAEFAQEAGWKRTKQTKLEKSEMCLVNTDELRTLHRVFRKYGIVFGISYPIIDVT